MGHLNVVILVRFISQVYQQEEQSSGYGWQQPMDKWQQPGYNWQVPGSGPAQVAYSEYEAERKRPRIDLQQPDREQSGYTIGYPFEKPAVLFGPPSDLPASLEEQSTAGLQQPESTLEKSPFRLGHPLDPSLPSHPPEDVFEHPDTGDGLEEILNSRAGVGFQHLHLVDSVKEPQIGGDLSTTFTKPSGQDEWAKLYVQQQSTPMQRIQKQIAVAKDALAKVEKEAFGSTKIAKQAVEYARVNLAKLEARAEVLRRQKAEGEVGMTLDNQVREEKSILMVLLMGLLGGSGITFVASCVISRRNIDCRRSWTLPQVQHKNVHTSGIF
eukprot:gnl/MRDRNA2_/MRDRNA2_160390_c0_seq1.p1 gnl/MRDRNA2_/MRDRNA2_160390_c0~~gnl/MRDRNA2_/MRDRNA2_160390_c0_seq1.p1  ORF type:complete len:326 (-),score=65.22 gnl/MRDRNA2_/MRDRNA2_160390_c0_seq1:307-1284(-)